MFGPALMHLIWEASDFDTTCGVTQLVKNICPLRCFFVLRATDLIGKTVIPFCTIMAAEDLAT